MSINCGDNQSAQPQLRKLRAYAFDPSVSLVVDTVEINNLVYNVRWEDDLAPGPIGEYLEVIDYDPTVDIFWEPVDLDDRYILAEQGLSPSESNPKFHQQMVYAVAMVTIQNFEKALGREILWASRLLDGGDEYESYVGKLRIYPHALREANAYYSPLKKALLFGYFPARPANKAHQLPGSTVFTCLSHDIIAHEVTHAVLDGLRRNFNLPTNPDVLAFHEAFADMVALFQHFSYPDVLRHQIARTKGNLAEQNMLGELAQQFGIAIGRYGSLRDAIGSVNKETGKWEPKHPDPTTYQNTKQPHARGSIFVAAVFEAFLTVYKGRIKDLLRIASGGSGILPKGEIHPDLVNRMATEASKTASHLLNICIRAVDYCPPVDITFGDYLRAMITADCDIVEDDPHNYRLALINSFRRRGIFPEGIKTLGVEILNYPRPELSGRFEELFGIIVKYLRDFKERASYLSDPGRTKGEEFYQQGGGTVAYGDQELSTREKIYNLSRYYMSRLHGRLKQKFANTTEFEELTGVLFDNPEENSFEVMDLRIVNRVGPDGDQINQIVFNLVQRVSVIWNDDAQEWQFTGRSTKGSMKAIGGCTLIFDLDTLALKYAIKKSLLDPEKLAEGIRVPNKRYFDEQRNFEMVDLPHSFSELGRYFHNAANPDIGEPFSLLHSSTPDQNV
ncbi:MAG: hypothetical protein MI807_22280 [Verrucomicrobiales bacterium]|nr:hypothetical protein [Verrucomicrobiales bacterium]